MDYSQHRLWECEFHQALNFPDLPHVSIIVEEREEYPYRIPFQTVKPVFPEGYGGQLTLVLDGHGTFQAGNRSWRVTSNQAFLYNYRDDAVRYYCSPKSTETWHFLWVGFQGIGAEKMIEEINSTWGYVFDLGEMVALRELLLYYERFKGNGCILTGSANVALATRIINLLLEDRERQSLNHSFPVPLTSVQEKLKQSPQIGELASWIGISRSHFSRRYREVTGETLEAYRQRYRLVNAMEYLLKTSMSVKEIAHQVGFSCYSSFFRAFVKRYGFSPRHFRNTQSPPEELAPGEPE